jgi:hypothetical protein
MFHHDFSTEVLTTELVVARRADGQIYPVLFNGSVSLRGSQIKQTQMRGPPISG